MKEKRKIISVYKRQCKGCSHVWFVDEKKQKNADLQSLTGSLTALGGLGDSALTRAAAHNSVMKASEMQESVKTCPSCGGNSYDESKFLIDPEDADSQSVLSGIKKCPECAEFVRSEAKKCKHCGYVFTEGEMSDIKKKLEKMEDRSGKLLEESSKIQKEEKKQTRIGCLMMIGIIAVISLFIGMCSSGDEKKETVSIQEKAWYYGGTLHDSTVSDWKKASSANKLATSADWLAATSWKEYLQKTGNVSSPLFKSKAKVLSDAVDTSITDLPSDSKMKVNEFASAILMMANDLGPENN